VGVKENFYTSVKEKVFANTKTTSQIKTKCLELESKHKEFSDKFNQSGFGVDQIQSSSIQDMLKKKFPYYSRMDELFGTRAKIKPTLLIQSENPVESSELGGLTQVSGVIDTS
jgi:hypothetical protein